MAAVFNLIVIGLVLLIAYWWANQGAFSALLHLLCVIAAGAIALAIWEPLVVGLLLRGSFFDNYAWGVGLIVPFVLILLVLRVTFDKSVGANIDLPRWANLTFGGAAGLAAGILTVGIFVIGAGFIQSQREIIGFTGYARQAERNGQVGEVQSMWFPVHTLTAEFYSMLSAGSLRPDFEGTPLRQYYPQLDRASTSLQRDSFAKGKGRTTLGPDDVKIQRVIVCEQCTPKRIAVDVMFEPGSRDFGEQLTVSSSQIRLIGQASGWTNPKVAYPTEFTQYSGHHRFDDMTHYISSEPGQQRSAVIIEFNGTDLGTQTPRFIQIKGTRYRLPRPNTDKWVVLDSTRYGGELQSGSSASTGSVEVSPTGIDITPAVKAGKDIRPVQASINHLPAGIQTTKKDDKNWISGGKGEFLTNAPDRPGKGLAVDGILEPEGTVIVQVEVSRGSPASLYKDTLRAAAGENPIVQLVDSQNRPYVPIGYIWQQPNGKTTIAVDFEHYVQYLKDLPDQPTSGTHKLKLVFQVTDGATVVGLKLGNATVGTCNVPVKSTKPAAPPPEAPKIAQEAPAQRWESAAGEFGIRPR